MGVDFYTCAICEYNFPDCGDYVTCEECYNHFCSDECASLKPIQTSDEEEFNEDLTSCCLCRKEVANDYILLGVLLRHYNLTKEQVLDLWRQEKNDEDEDEDEDDEEK